ncbi:hypothetical protein [Thiofilum flexile]|uniref:hypothetical protein n=1 Tax=Thiofilum flexile TaxID=125627 RepID=UPI0013A54C37|nr:hypothetical protein [Thiofilum flexile]
MEAIARPSTRNALLGYERPVGDLKYLTLGSMLTETHGIYEVYIAGERPEDAEVISQTTVDRITGEVRVEVFLKPKA